MTEGTIREKLQYRDIYETIELICGELSSCRDLLKIRPTFKRHNDNFDKILKVCDCFVFEINNFQSLVLVFHRF